MSVPTVHAPEPLPGPAFTVYTTGPACQKCNATKRLLRKRGHEPREVLLSDVPEIADAFRAEGHLTAPVVVTADGETFSDFRPDRLIAAVARLA